MASEAAASQTPQEQALKDLGQVRYSFDQVGIARWVFEEVPTPDRPKQSEPANVEISVVAIVGLVSDSNAEVRLTFRIIPDPAARPYSIQMELVGSFGCHGGTREQLLQFCQVNAPVILFPYARQAINELTSNARFGAVRLPLMNLNEVLKAHAWQPIEEPGKIQRG